MSRVLSWIVCVTVLAGLLSGGVVLIVYAFRRHRQEQHIRWLFQKQFSQNNSIKEE
jgi:hypothetical protein